MAKQDLNEAAVILLAVCAKTYATKLRKSELDDELQSMADTLDKVASKILKTLTKDTP